MPNYSGSSTELIDHLVDLRKSMKFVESGYNFKTREDNNLINISTIFGKLVDLQAVKENFEIFQGGLTIAKKETCDYESIYSSMRECRGVLIKGDPENKNINLWSDVESFGYMLNCEQENNRIGKFLDSIES